MIFRVGNNVRQVEFDIAIDARNPPEAALMFFCQNNQPPEPEVVHFMFRALREGDCCIDAGANIGFFSLLMSQLVGETGKVYAFEPGSNNLPRLESNLEANAIQNVVLFKQPLWCRSGVEVTLHLYSDGGFNSLRPVDDQKTAQQMDLSVALGDVAFVKPPVLLKLDVEGAEFHILEGATRLFYPQTLKYIICELNEEALQRFNRTSGLVREYFSERNYRTFLLDPAGGFPTMIPRSCTLRVERQNTNVLFSRMEWVAELWPEVRI